MKRRVWTMVKISPFTMGGDGYYPGTTEIDVINTTEIKGIEFFSFKTPKGTLRVCEGITGGIIANSFDEVINFTEGCTTESLLKDIEIGATQLNNAREKDMTNEEFFLHYKF